SAGDVLLPRPTARPIPVPEMADEAARGVRRPLSSRLARRTAQALLRTLDAAREGGGGSSREYAVRRARCWTAEDDVRALLPRPLGGPLATARRSLRVQPVPRRPGLLGLPLGTHRLHPLGDDRRPGRASSVATMLVGAHRRRGGG